MSNDVAEPILPDDGSHIDLTDQSLRKWIELRMQATRAGKAERVRIPLVHASTGWGCVCPPDAVRSRFQWATKLITAASSSRFDENEPYFKMRSQPSLGSCPTRSRPTPSTAETRCREQLVALAPSSRMAFTALASRAARQRTSSLSLPRPRQQRVSVRRCEHPPISPAWLELRR